nr:MBL fold metallo-hydrolase [Phytohabitans houttuyneae]
MGAARPRRRAFRGDRPGAARRGAPARGRRDRPGRCGAGHPRPPRPRRGAGAVRRAHGRGRGHRRAGDHAGADPGHTGDSICFLVEVSGERVIFTGDTILGRGTTIVAWPDGDLGEYLASLEVLAGYDAVPALPGHGPALADCGAAARFYLAHRRARLDQVRQAISEGARSAQEVVAKVYADVDPSLWPAAEWSVRAQLAYLRRDGGESTSGSVWLDSP